jgi:hypothetical protein
MSTSTWPFPRPGKLCEIVAEIDGWPGVGPRFMVFTSDPTGKVWCTGGVEVREPFVLLEDVTVVSIDGTQILRILTKDGVHGFVHVNPLFAVREIPVNP